jgi:excinuclease ABC subunit B
MEIHKFKLKTKMKPTGSQPEAIEKLTKGINSGLKFQTLLGVTGSGKTFTIANIIKNVNKKVLVIAHNKTLAAQLYEELKSYFPENRVEYFVSYYDYYQPESYIPSTDKYIEKDAQVNAKIDQMRLAATSSVLSRNDTIIVASVSCIYGLGNPSNYIGFRFSLDVGEEITRKEIISKFVESQYERNDKELEPGRFRVKGDTIEFISHTTPNIIKIELFEDKIERIIELDKLNYTKIEEWKHYTVYPARHFMIPEEELEQAMESIKKQLQEDLPRLNMMEAHRLKQRTLYDLEMIKETGYCKGIENYSRHFDNRNPGEKPYTLMDYFGENFLIVIDESHQTIPQLHGMYKGDKARKKNLIDYGFRLTSSYDNRPLNFEEFEEYIKNNQVVFVSATPGDYEKENSTQIVEQIIRPTGLVDPEVFVRPIKGQIDDIKSEINIAIKRGDRILITTLTKKLSEELTEYLSEQGIKTRYLHSEIDTLERTEIIRQLRLGEFDCLVGINLLREGLDIPEVGFVGILDADKEGFLRNDKSLIQTIGRAARNVNSRVVLYADVMTDSIRNALEETNRRRKIQVAYNKEYNITPKTIIKPIKEKEIEVKDIKHIPKAEIPNLIIELEAKMRRAAENLEFEEAISIRNQMNKLKERIVK